LSILVHVANGTINHAVQLAFKFLRIAILLWQGHPTGVDRMAKRLIDLPRTEEFTHLFSAIFTVLEKRHECGSIKLLQRFPSPNRSAWPTRTSLLRTPLGPAATVMEKDGIYATLQRAARRPLLYETITLLMVMPL
jgi:hypothetical protein